MNEVYKDIAEERNEDLKILLLKAFHKGYNWGVANAEIPDDEQIIRMCDDQQVN